MNELVQVAVRGNASPDSYEDFSSMLESSLASVRKLQYVLSVDTADERLWGYLTNYATEHGLRVLYGQQPYPVAYAVFFLTAISAKSFDYGNVQSARQPTIFLF